jgi:hypothetical protein
VIDPRRFPPPLSAEETDACFIVRDANGQALAYVYFEDEPGRRSRRLKGPGHSGGTKTIALRYEQTTNLRAPVAE